jgi:hypothetical protein
MIPPFGYKEPTEQQKYGMELAGEAVSVYAAFLEQALPHGTNKDLVMQKLHEVALLVNSVILRET